MKRPLSLWNIILLSTHCMAFSITVWISGTCLTNILRGTWSIDVRAEAFNWIRRTCNVSLTRVIWNVSHFFNKFVGLQCRPTLARSRPTTSTIKNKLYWEIDFSNYRFTNTTTVEKLEDLYPVCERRHRTMSPARPYR